MKRATVASVALGVLATAHIGARLTGYGRLADVTQPLLMPAVTARMASRGRLRPRLARWVGIGQVFACAGDTIPRFQSGTPALRSMIGSFALTHVAYLVGFTPAAIRRARSAPVQLAGAALGYAALYLAVVRLCDAKARELGLQNMMATYGALLAATGVVTAAHGGKGAVGGALFVGSDMLIALREFVPGWDPRVRHVRVGDPLIMASYVAAQTLIADAVSGPPDR
ncbi:MAG: lysoplasmalogenase family protein [Beutenbergiaceae bacterium]